MTAVLEAETGLPVVSLLPADLDLTIRPMHPRSSGFIATYRSPAGVNYDPNLEALAQQAWCKHPDSRFWSAEMSELDHNGLIGTKPLIGSFLHMAHGLTMWRVKWAVHRRDGGDNDITHWTFRAPWGWTFEIFND